LMSAPGLTAGKKRGFCRQESSGAISAELMSAFGLAAGKSVVPARNCQRRQRRAADKLNT
jgi:hypothetical protein